MFLIFKYFWVLFIVTPLLNAIFIKRRVQKYIIEKPELEDGYNMYIKNSIFLGVIPAVIMGIAILSQSVESMFDFFQPRKLNPYVLAFHTCVVIYWILSIRWIYFNKGAEFLEEHPGLIVKNSFGKTSNVTAKEVKIFFPLMLLGGVIGEVMMWNMNFSIPKLPAIISIFLG
mgnify:FL=1